MFVDLRDVVELICLTYHEARNVRHPIKAGKLDNASRYERLVGLSKNRDAAWRQMSELKSRAANFGDVEAATEEFQRVFDLSLSDLVELYEMPIWKHSACGGNKWADITSKVRDLVQALKSDEASEAERLYQVVISMCHNTGRVADKLRRLSC